MSIRNDQQLEKSCLCDFRDANTEQKIPPFQWKMPLMEMWQYFFFFKWSFIFHIYITFYIYIQLGSFTSIWVVCNSFSCYIRHS